MKTLRDHIQKTKSARESAAVALNATQEAYTYLEAERKGELRELMHQAVQDLQDAGTDPQTAYSTVASRGSYLREMVQGTKMFHHANANRKTKASKPYAGDAASRHSLCVSE